MTFAVLLTDAAEADLEELYDYIYQNDSPEKAYYVLDQIETIFNSLNNLPERGTYPKELIALGIRQFREIFFKPYRIIYQIITKKIYIMLITDGRRDMQTILQQRLLSQPLSVRQ